MPGLTDTDGLTDVQRDILGAVREFTEAEIIPTATELDHSDTYPDQIVAGLVDRGVFGLTIGPEYGTKVVAAHQMMVMAARRKDEGRQSDLEAGMAKYLASEYG
jgi:alkylation response protein AidB-like acyl-CoA dehydrogenase